MMQAAALWAASLLGADFGDGYRVRLRYACSTAKWGEYNHGFGHRVSRGRMSKRVDLG